MSRTPSEPIPKTAARISIGSFFFLAGLNFASWASRIPDIKLGLHLSDAGLGTVLLALPIGLLVSLPFSGWLVTHFGSRKMLLLAAALYTSILPMIGLTHTSWQIMIVLFLFGMVGNLANIAANTQAVSLEELYGRSIMASFHGLWSLAGFSGAAIGTLMINFHMSPLSHFLVVTGLSYILIISLYRNTLRQDINAGTKPPLFARPDNTLLKLGLIALCCMVCEGAMFDWSGVYFQKVVEAPKGLTTLGYTCFMATMAGGRFIGDSLVTRFGTKRMIQNSGVVIAVGLIIAIALPYLVPAAIGFMLVGIGVSSVVPLVYGAAGRSKTLSPGVALAAVSTVGYLGFLFGPPLIGFIAQAASLRWSLGLIAVLGFTTTIISSKAKLT